MDPAFLADLIVLLHLGYVGFVILGLVTVWIGVVLHWRWVRSPIFRVPHLVCTLIVPVEALGGILCPLTTWENQLRAEAGQRADEVSFMGRLARDLLFYQAPEWVFTVCYLAFGLIVLGTFFFVPIRKARGRASD